MLIGMFPELSFQTKGCIAIGTFMRRWTQVDKHMFRHVALLCECSIAMVAFECCNYNDRIDHKNGLLLSILRLNSRRSPV